MRLHIGISVPLCLWCGLAFGQQAAPPAVSEPKVAPSCAGVNTSAWIELNGPVTVCLANLRQWNAAGNDPNTLRLFLAGRMLPKSEPTLISLSQQYLNFETKLDPADRTLFVQVLSEARRARGHKIPMSVGVKESKQPFESTAYAALNVYPWYTWMVVAFMAVLLVLLIVMGAKSDLLRDTSTAKAQAARAPYSLGRVQMAFWFYLVVASYMYIGLLTLEYNTLTASVLALIGISAGTGLASVFIDRQKINEIVNKRTELETTQAALGARIREIEAASPVEDSTLDRELQAKRSTLAKAEAALVRLEPVPPPPSSNGFRRDLLSDGVGLSFHRLQIVVWTLVFGMIFVRTVYRDLAMPDFDASLLGLMGISSGAYLGFKIPEKAK